MESSAASGSALAEAGASGAGPSSSSPLLEPEPVPVLEFSVNPHHMKSALADVVGTLPSKTTLPVLQTVLLATDGSGHLRITATDLDTTVTRRITAQVTEPGAALVPGRKIYEIARELPDGCMLDVRLKEDVLVIWCKETRTRYRLPTLPVDQFPSPPAVNWEEDGVLVPGATLGLLIERTAFAASTEETRPILNGVLWERTDGQMAMVATNGHRLAVTRLGIEDAAERPEAILHPRALNRVARLYAGGESIQVAQSDNHIGFRSGDGWELITRLITGPYPPYRRVLPEDNDKVLVVDKGILAGAIRRMAIMASEQTHRIVFSLGGQMVRISVETPDVGAAHEDVAVDYQGDPLEIGFNALYLLEVLRYLPAGEIRMTFKASERAVTLAPLADETGASSEYLVMPLRLLT